MTATAPVAPPDVPDVDVVSKGNVDIVRLNRPEVRNAVRQRTLDDMELAFRTTKGRCIIVTGADPAFCSGDDVRELLNGGEGPNGDVPPCPQLPPAADAMLYCDVPIVAAVNGAAVGWGIEIALMSDLRIASERARFGAIFVLRGLVSDTACLGRLASLVGREKATELLLTGDVIDAEEALRIGLVSKVVPHDDLLDEALALAERIASRPPLALRAVKEGLRRAVDPDWATLGRWVAAMQEELKLTDDHREGVRSFLEKREPSFKGR
ncbi:MAG TPA: enoyl-CoA hydratase-related protein [Acidimicrobiales bacterium]|nr:enoyl-CoA hydratase-related protein [Acidimicrobiales bacterium]